MSISSIENALQKIQVGAMEAAGSRLKTNEIQSPSEADSFSNVLKASLDKVNALDKNAQMQAEAMTLGTSNRSMSDVMLDMKKADIGFQMTVQVRNRLVNAYRDIMTMSV
jgi:flagellar hook-basal body complex protein FliE